MVGLNPELFHLQTRTSIELASMPVIRIGKPNQRVSPDIDASDWPNSNIISRIHAAILFDSGSWFIEDIGSTNGTFVNDEVLSLGDRRRLQPGDRIGLGHPDLVTFLFRSCFDLDAELMTTNLRDYLMATTAVFEHCVPDSQNSSAREMVKQRV